MKNYLKNCAIGALALLGVFVLIAAIVGIIVLIEYLHVKYFGGDDLLTALVACGLFSVILILVGGFIPNDPPGYSLPPPRPKPPPNNHRRK